MLSSFFSCSFKESRSHVVHSVRNGKYKDVEYTDLEILSVYRVLCQRFFTFLFVLV